MLDNSIFLKNILKMLDCKNEPLDLISQGLHFFSMNIDLIQINLDCNMKFIKMRLNCYKTKFHRKFDVT